MVPDTFANQPAFAQTWLLHLMPCCGGLWVNTMRFGSNAVDYSMHGYSYKHRRGMEDGRSLLHSVCSSIVLAINVLRKWKRMVEVLPSALQAI